MLHRHLNHQRFTLAAIDDIISRGQWQDWVELRRAVLSDPALLDESVAGWKTARVQRPVQILDSLDGIETGVRQLIRDEPLETVVVDYHGARITVFRPKARFCASRRADPQAQRHAGLPRFRSLGRSLGNENVACALQSFDRLYPQDSGESPLQQLQVQLANALPYDLEETGLGEYKNLNPRWHDWLVVKAACSHLSARIFDRVCDMSADHSGNPEMNMKTTRKVRMGF